MKTFDIEKAALVTHRGCMDGSTVAIVFLAAGGLRENIRFSSPNHRDVDEIVEELLETWSGPILIADVSISMGLAEQVIRNDVFLLDHHKSAIPLQQFSWCEVDINNTRAGGKMLFDWFVNNFTTMSLVPYKELVDLADDHDRWIKNYKESDLISVFHEVLGQELFIDRFLKNPNPRLNQMEQYAVDLELTKRDNYIKRKIKDVVVVQKNIQGHDVGVAFVLASEHQSLLGNTICEDPRIDANICVLVGTNISMRASKDCPVDLSVLAKKLMGGGHKAASACPLDKFLNNNNLVELIINHEIWNNL